MNEPCHPVRRLLARGPVCTVEACSCGVLHVSVGCLTLRLQKEVVASLWETLGEALRSVSAREGRAPSPAMLFASNVPQTGRPS